MKIERVKQHPVYSGIVAEKEDITPGRVPRKVIWQKIGNDIFATCPACSAINNIDADVGRNGTVSPCAVCHNCQTHFFLRLKDWDGDITIRCELCRKMLVGPESQIKKKGWRLGPNDCECCASYRCPKCADK